MSAKQTKKNMAEQDRNPDPITDAPGAHPVGVGVGAAAGGAMTGAAAGAVAGPVGAAVGAVVGAVAGGYAGKAVAESIDPTVETEYWREAYSSRPYYDDEVEFEQYEPAYRYGWESRARYPDQRFEDLESDLESEWTKSYSDASGLEWQRARSATRDAWDRIDQQRSATDSGAARKPR